MYIKFDKISEDATTVTYLIETDTLDESVRTIQYKFVKALCTFNKETETISYDVDKTDPFYFQQQKEPAAILHHLKKLNLRGAPFPEIYDIATG